jgi:hypothetical protein
MPRSRVDGMRKNRKPLCSPIRPSLFASTRESGPVRSTSGGDQIREWGWPFGSGAAQRPIRVAQLRGTTVAARAPPCATRARLSLQHVDPRDSLHVSALQANPTERERRARRHGAAHLLQPLELEKPADDRSAGWNRLLLTGWNATVLRFDPVREIRRSPRGEDRAISEIVRTRRRVQAVLQRDAAAIRGRPPLHG